MEKTDHYNTLPDPERHAEFYQDTPTKRLIAWVVDTVVIFGMSILIIPFTAFTALFYYPLLILLISLVYRITTLAGGSATLGMRFVAIEFRTSRGEKFDLSIASLHTIGYLISVSMVFPQILSIILMLTSARKQGLTDMVLGSVAINRAARS